jgi:hypothetical protein
VVNPTQLKPGAKPPWQLRVLEKFGVKAARRGEFPADGADDLGGPIAGDAEAADGAVFVPQFVRVPTGREW